MSPPLIGRGPHKAMMLSDVCLSVWLSDVWRLSVCLSRTSGLCQEQRGLGRLKFERGSPGHVTRTPLSTTKGQRSRPPGRFTHRGVNASGSCSSDRGNLLLHCGLVGGARGFGANRKRRGAWVYCGGRPPTACFGLTYLFLYCLILFVSKYLGQWQWYFSLKIINHFSFSFYTVLRQIFYIWF